MTDRSHGCDNLVFELALADASLPHLILRMPRKPVATRPHAGHNAITQAWMNAKLEEVQAPAPRLLGFGDHHTDQHEYCLETCVGVSDASKYNPSNEDGKELWKRALWRQVGEAMRSFHAIGQLKSVTHQGVGYIKQCQLDSPKDIRAATVHLVGSCGSLNWTEWFEEDLLANLREALARNGITERELVLIQDLWKFASSECKQLCRTNEEVTVVHVDLSPDNIRVDEDGGLAGIIDFADVMLGDPLLDFGRLLASLHDSPQLVLLALEGYGVKLAAGEEEGAPSALWALLQVYAAWFLLWRTYGDEEGAGMKERQALHNILKLELPLTAAQ